MFTVHRHIFGCVQSNWEGERVRVEIHPTPFVLSNVDSLPVLVVNRDINFFYANDARRIRLFYLHVFYDHTAMLFALPGCYSKVFLPRGRVERKHVYRG